MRFQIMRLAAMYTHGIAVPPCTNHGTCGLSTQARSSAVYYPIAALTSSLYVCWLVVLLSLFIEQVGP